jgi:hypothetical protein
MHFQKLANRHRIHTGKAKIQIGGQQYLINLTRSKRNNGKQGNSSQKIHR